MLSREQLNAKATERRWSAAARLCGLRLLYDPVINDKFCDSLRAVRHAVKVWMRTCKRADAGQERKRVR